MFGVALTFGSIWDLNLLQGFLMTTLQKEGEVGNQDK
jgi:hypothetical protein